MSTRAFNANTTTDADTVTKWAKARDKQGISYEYAKQGPNVVWHKATGDISCLANGQVEVVDALNVGHVFPAPDYLYRRIQVTDTESAPPSPPPEPVSLALQEQFSDHVASTKQQYHELRTGIKEALKQQDSRQTRLEGLITTQQRMMTEQQKQIQQQQTLFEEKFEQATNLIRDLHASARNQPPQPSPAKVPPKARPMVLGVSGDDAHSDGESHHTDPIIPQPHLPEDTADFSPFEPTTWLKYMNSQLSMELLELRLRNEYSQIVRGPTAKTQINDFIQLVTAVATIDTWHESPLMAVVKTKIRRMRDAGAFHQGYDLGKLRKELAEEDHKNDPYAAALAKVGRRPNPKPRPKADGRIPLPFRHLRNACWACGESGHTSDACPGKTAQTPKNEVGGPKKS